MSDDIDDFLAPAAPWAVTLQSISKTDDNSKGDIFSHRNKFDSIAKDRLEYEKQRAAKAQEKQEKDRQRKNEKAAKKEGQGSAKRESVDAEDKGSLKRRRIDAKDGAKLLASIGLSGNTSVIALDGSDEEPGAQAVSPVRRSPRTNHPTNLFSPSKPSVRLERTLEPSSATEDDLEITSIIARPTSPPPEEQEEEDSDAEIAALTRKARENARRKQEMAKSGSSFQDANMENGRHLPSPAPTDPTIEIFISSHIPNTKELICHRKLSQTLAVVREVWCKKQEFPKPFADSVFFTYRGRRLYDSTTVRRLGIAVDEIGNIYREDDPIKEGVHRVHVEAVTAEIFNEVKAKRARQAKLASAQYDEVEEAEPAAADAGESKPQEHTLRLIVKAKGKQDFKVVVFHTTRIQKIIKNAKKQFGFAAEQEVYMKTGDDEELNPEELVGDTELDDMDCLDLFLRN